MTQIWVMIRQALQQGFSKFSLTDCQILEAAKWYTWLNLLINVWNHYFRFAKTKIKNDTSNRVYLIFGIIPYFRPTKKLK